MDFNDLIESAAAVEEGTDGLRVLHVGFELLEFLCCFGGWLNSFYIERMRS